MFCHKCGRELPAGSQFCPECGSKVTEPTQSTPPPAPSKYASQEPQSAVKSTDKSTPTKFEDGVCPNCGSHDCEIQVQQNVTGSGSNYNAGMGCLGFLLTGPFGLLCGLCGTGSKTSTTHKSMWVCKKCGHQFLPRKDLITNLSAGAAVICCILTGGAFLSIFTALEALRYESTGGFVVAVILAAITIGIFYFVLSMIRKNYGKGPLKDVLTNGLLTVEEYNTIKSVCWIGFVLSAVTLIIAFWVIA